MKTILKVLRSQYVKCEALIERRELTHDRRSARWQESEAGALYESDTLELYSVKDNLEEAMRTLEEITGDYKQE